MADLNDLNDLLSRLPIDQLAQQTGASASDVTAAAATALPALLGGLAAQTTDESTAAGLISALGQHDNDLAAGTIDISDLNPDEGDKIVNKVFGGETDNVAAGIADAVPAAAVDQGLVKKLLPMLAPIVLSFVMSQITKKGGAPAAQGGGLGDILGGLLGGGGGGNPLGSVLGSVLGGGGAGGGGLGNVLGSILGGNK